MPKNDRIHDLGVLPLEKVPLLLNALDVAVICNLNNQFGRYCFPQKAAEIMACDVPLVAANIGSMAEKFKDHPEWLFTPGSSSNCPASLPHEVALCLTDDAPPRARCAFTPQAPLSDCLHGCRLL